MKICHEDLYKIAPLEKRLMMYRTKAAVSGSKETFIVTFQSQPPRPQKSFRCPKAFVSTNRPITASHSRPRAFFDARGRSGNGNGKKLTVS